MGMSAQVAITGTVGHAIAKLTHPDRRVAGPLNPGASQRISLRALGLFGLQLRFG
jgi:hypothetical protein